ncbi:MAG: SusC/RagA family TonB-linked outer membrane protein [Gemmatimonadaceae bacterium]
MSRMQRLFAAALASFLPVIASAQQAATITGRVTGENQNPIANASVFIGALGLGVQTGSDGRYSLTIPAARVTPSAILAVRAIGYKQATATVTLSGGNVSKDFVIETNPLRLGEVVVTGAGTTSTAEKLGNTVNSVKGSEVQRSNESNIVNALAAKAPGVEVTSQAGDPGSSSSIIIRGLKTIQGNGQPLFVVDGSPIDNSTNFTADDISAGTSSANRASDLNPNDIESIEVLKGASAAAIYGARAANGVILITTKSGRAGITRYGLRSSYSLDETNRRIPLQRTWGRGQFDDASFGNCSGPGCYPTSNSWGPKIAAGSPSYDHWSEAFGNGHVSDNSGSISGGDDRRQFFASAGYLGQTGTIKSPNSWYDRTTVRLKASQSMTEKLRFGGNFAYSDVRASYVQKGNNLNGLLLGLARTPPNFNNFPYLVNGLHRSYRYPNPANNVDDRVYDNPFFVLNEDKNTSTVGRSFGNVNIDYEALSWLTIKYTLGADYSSDARLEGLAPQSAGIENGNVWNGTITNLELDHNLLATAQKSWNPNFATTLTLGQNLNARELNWVQARGINFISPDLFNTNNTVQTNLAAQNFFQKTRIAGHFAQFQSDLWNKLYFTAGVRADQSSTFPKANRTNWYPKATLAWNVIGEGGGKGPLSYLKARAAFGAVGREPFPYQIFDAYSGGQVAFAFGTGATSPGQNGSGGLVSSSTRGTQSLKPERTEEAEGGFDFGLFNSKVDGQVTYYSSKTTDVIFGLPVSPSTGYGFLTRNGGTVTNKGIEVQANWRAFETRNLKAEFGVNWAKNKNKLTELSGADFVGITGGFGVSTAVKGEPLGAFYGTDFARCRYGTPDAGNIVDDVDINAACRAAKAPNGALYVAADRFPVLDPNNRVLGNPNPDWTGALRTNITLFRKLVVNGLVDVKHGGVVWNGTRLALQRFGTAASTVNRATCSQRTASGSNCAVWTGNEQVFGTTIIKSPGVVGPGAGKPVAVGENWYRQGLGNNFNGPTSQGVEDGGYIKLREIGVSYTMDGGWVKGLLGFQSLDLRVAGRNLATWTDYSGIDPETNLEGALGIGRGQDYFNNPQNRSIVFSVGLNR